MTNEYPVDAGIIGVFNYRRQFAEDGAYAGGAHEFKVTPGDVYICSVLGEQDAMVIFRTQAGVDYRHENNDEIIGTLTATSNKLVVSDPCYLNLKAGDVDHYDKTYDGLFDKGGHIVQVGPFGKAFISSTKYGDGRYFDEVSFGEDGCLDSLIIWFRDTCEFCEEPSCDGDENCEARCYQCGYNDCEGPCDWCGDCDCDYECETEEDED